MNESRRSEPRNGGCPIPDPDSPNAVPPGADLFRLHYVQGTRRCVARYDTLRAALEAAFKRLEKDRGVQLWISDDGRHVLLDGDQLRARFAEREQGERPGG